MKCYHGTTKENLINILNGEEKDNNVWYCSDDDILYVYPLNKVDEYDEEEDIQEFEHRAIISAFESAQLTAACLGHDEIYVIELEIPDDELEDDGSCDNMADVASCCCLDNISDHITKYYKSEDYNPHLRPFYISGVMGNCQFNQDELDDSLREATEQIAKSEIYLELLPEGYKEVYRQDIN